MVTSTGAWPNASAGCANMPKPWKPLFDQQGTTMKGLEPLLNPLDHMNDDEQIGHAEQFHTDLALLQHRQRQTFNLKNYSLTHCETCGNEIPQARRQSIPGVNLCVNCKAAEERLERLGR
ncbi:TraR/DksA C4-type zinc finger protein [Methylobacter sp. Wu1]|uniref:TraR/DksA C4-type zinc finger protein n=1 Tax=Methylobacter sp. Wu1 TaxID=3119359 RepID=UPI002F94FA2E